jgi:hypothetical protein
MMPKFVRRLLLIGGGILLLCVSVYLYLILYDGQEQQRVTSPDGKIIAEVRDYNQSAATDAVQVTVELRTASNPFRHTVLLCLNYGGTVTISWKDATNLQIECAHCENLRSYKLERSWNGVSIHYASAIPTESE